MEATPVPEFLEVPRLLENSQPRPRAVVGRYLLGLILVVVLSAALMGAGRQATEALLALLLAGVVTFVLILTFVMVRNLRAEQQRVDAVAELVQLRRWTDAAVMLDQYLSAPTRTHHLRAQALTYLAAVLARFHRFDDAIAVQNHLIDHELVDGPMSVGLRLGRAMAMLREDHLFDADRAISELRRGPAAESGPLALVEIYRDVKTGHPAEAIETFRVRLPALREQLGHRLADAWALVARAHDLLGQEPEARSAFAKATLLAPAVELYRRYPEVQKLAGRYEPSPAPKEAA